MGTLSASYLQLLISLKLFQNKYFKNRVYKDKDFPGIINKIIAKMWE
jgi:hypothetical protein